MRGKTPKLLIGVFVTVAVFLGTVTVIWLGASKYFQKGNLYVTYFDESVQGLSVDSNVKYRGVNVGNVRAIQVAPDHRLIEVVMKINLRPGEEQNLTAKLRSAGLTGIVNVELDRRYPGDADRSPSFSFQTEYPVILSVPSDTKYYLSVVENILKQLREVDFPAIFERVESIAAGIDHIVHSEKIEETLANLSHLSGKLGRAADRIESIAQNRDIEGVLAETRETIGEMQALVKDVRREVQGLQVGAVMDRAGQAVAKAGQAMDKAGQLVDGLDRQGRGLALDLRITAENLQRTSESLDRLIERLEANPSDLLFSKPAPPQRPE